jgi:hypothetical protein
MKIKLYKHQLISATTNATGKVFLPWDWPEMRSLEKMWPDGVPIEIEVGEPITESTQY